MSEEDYFEKEYFNNEMNSFIKHITLIILNSRLSENKSKKEKNNISLKLYSIEQEKNFDIEEIFDFIDDYMFLASPNQIRQSLSDCNSGCKSYEIDFFIIKENEYILMEKWYFSYFDDINIHKSKKYLEKKLSCFTRSIYNITRLIPLYQFKTLNYKIDYKAYKNELSNYKFNGNTKFIEISNKTLTIKIKVEYLIDNILKKGNDEMTNTFKRPRFYSLTVKKKSIPSFEVLFTEEEIETNKDENNGKKIGRKLSHNFDRENNIYNYLSKEEIKNLSPNINESCESNNTINSNISLELNIKVDSSINLMLTDIKEKYNILKERINTNQTNNIGINVNKLYIYTILDFNFN